MDAVKAIVQQRRWRWAAGFIALFSVAVMLLPQFNLLNYFFAFAVAIPLTLVVGIISTRMATDASWGGTWHHIGHLLMGALSLALIPLVIVLLSATIIQNCDIPLGLGFYAMGPLMGSLYAAVAGLLCATLTNRRWATWLFVLWWMGSIAWDVAHVYYHPPIFAYNGFAGFFSGAIYDEVIRIGGTYTVYRCYTAALVLLILVGCHTWVLHRRPWTRWWIPGLAGLLALGLFTTKGQSGFEISRDDVIQALGGRLETAHFVLHYTTGGLVAQHIEALADDHEFRYEQLRALLGVEHPDKIRSFLYDTPEQKRGLMGADRTYIAKPWNGEVHLNALMPGAPVLKHELAHVFGASISTGLLKLPARYGVLPNMGLVEGFAEACTWSRGRLTPHQWSAALVELELAPPIERILGATGFLSTHAGQAYTVAGSFLRYLLDTHGVERFRQVYESGDVEGTYGTSVQELEGRWHTFLADRTQVPLRDEDKRLARFRYDSPSLFGRVCALETARWANQANEATKAQEYCQALGLRRKIVGVDPDNPGHLWHLGNAIMLTSAWDEAARTYQKVIDSETNNVMRAHAQIRLADLQWLQDDRQGAKSGYESLSDAPLSEGSKRALDIRLAALQWTDLRAAKAVRDSLLNQKLNDPEVIDVLAGIPTEERPALVEYLMARRWLRIGRYSAALVAFERALGKGLSLRRVHRETLFQKGRLLVLLKRPSEARPALEKALAAAVHEGHKTTIQDWLARCEWLTKKVDD
jgi:tetratricopeptide (TPR) repeat protein